MAWTKNAIMQLKQPFALTLAILKPHVVKSPFALQKIRDLIIINDFKVVRSRRLTINLEQAEFFYAEHKGKFFYNRLITFISSGPSDVYILARHDAILKWRHLLGPAKVYQTQFTNPNTIRSMFGLSDTRNAAHGSDSEESAKREIAIFFKEFDIQKWYKTEEDLFNSGKVNFDPLKFVHTIDNNSVDF